MWLAGAFALSSGIFADESGTALVGQLNSLNGRIEGSIQINEAGSVTLNGGAAITGNLLMPGTPSLRVNGTGDPPLVVSAGGAGLPEAHRVTLNGNATLGGGLSDKTRGRGQSWCRWTRRAEPGGWY